MDKRLIVEDTLGSISGHSESLHLVCINNSLFKQEKNNCKKLHTIVECPDRLSCGGAEL